MSTMGFLHLGIIVNKAHETKSNSWEKGAVNRCERDEAADGKTWHFLKFSCSSGVYPKTRVKGIA